MLSCRWGLVLPITPEQQRLAMKQRAGRKVSNLSTDQLKLEFLKFFSEGMTVEQALTSIDRSYSSYEKWRREDADFKASVERVRSIRTRAGGDDRPWLSFEDFSERYLDAHVFDHMGNIVDLIEGREPRWVHQAMTYEQAEPDLLIANMPPEHAKSTTVTINYIVYRICMDPNIRVIIVSKTQSMAEKFLYSIKTRLTHPKYADLISQYAPQGGFDGDSEAWNKNMIYVSDQARDSGEKDPTVQALGIRGHITGARADLIILDDTIDSTNFHEFEKQIHWVQTEVISRIAASGALLVVGTRFNSRDLYSELRDPMRYPDEESPWTYLAMPAVLNFADDPEDWETCWPRSNQPEPGVKGAAAQPDVDGLFPKWDGPRLAKKRARMSPRSWSLTYMQRQVAEDAIFDIDAIKASVNGSRQTGLIPVGMPGQRPQGMDGLVTVAGLDPATSGHTAAVCIGLDVRTQKRYVLDFFNKAGTSPEEIRELVKLWANKYNLAEWRIEKNGFQGFLTHDRELNEFCAGRGTILRPHWTGSNKHDSDFGVASMAMLFTGWKDGNQLIELPSSHNSEAAKAWIEQLATWAPDLPKSQKTDLVMSTWFAELACRDRVQAMGAFGRSHVKNPWASPWDRRQQTTVNLLDAEANHLWNPVGA